MQRTDSCRGHRELTQQWIAPRHRIRPRHESKDNQGGDREKKLKKDSKTDG